MTRLQDLCRTLPKLFTTPAPPVAPGFKFFPKLPPELRNMIWTLQCQDQRVIKVFEHKNNPREPSDSNVPGQLRHPPLLHVCRESREEGLRHYTKCFERPRCVLAIVKGKAGFENICNTVFINYSVDKIFIQTLTTESYNGCGENFETKAFQLIKNVDISWVSNGDYKNMMATIYTIQGLLRYAKSVKIRVLVAISPSEFPVLVAQFVIQSPKTAHVFEKDYEAARKIGGFGIKNSIEFLWCYNEAVAGIIQTEE